MSATVETPIEAADVELTIDNAENTKPNKNKSKQNKTDQADSAEKFKALHDKNVMLTQENAKLKSQSVSVQKKVDSHKTDMEKMLAQMEKLQNLNKITMAKLLEERKRSAELELQTKQSQLYMAERDAKTQELQDKFESSIADIQSKIESHSKAESAATDSAAMKEKIEAVLAEVNSRHEVINEMIQKKDGEIEAANARSQKLTEICLALEANNKEILEKLDLTTKHRDALQETLNMYSEKFQGFQKTMTDTTELVGEYKKQIAAVKKENELLNLKVKKSGTEALGMYDKLKTVTSELEKEKRKREALANLCQTLKGGNAAKDPTPEDQIKATTMAAIEDIANISSGQDID